MKPAPSLKGRLYRGVTAPNRPKSVTSGPQPPSRPMPMGVLPFSRPNSASGLDKGNDQEKPKTKEFKDEYVSDEANQLIISYAMLQVGEERAESPHTKKDVHLPHIPRVNFTLEHGAAVTNEMTYDDSNTVAARQAAGGGEEADLGSIEDDGMDGRNESAQPQFLQAYNVDGIDAGGTVWDEGVGQGQYVMPPTSGNFWAENAEIDEDTPHGGRFNRGRGRVGTNNQNERLQLLRGALSQEDNNNNNTPSSSSNGASNAGLIVGTSVNVTALKMKPRLIQDPPPTLGSRSLRLQSHQIKPRHQDEQSQPQTYSANKTLSPEPHASPERPSSPTNSPHRPPSPTPTVNSIFEELTSPPLAPVMAPVIVTLKGKASDTLLSNQLSKLDELDEKAYAKPSSENDGKRMFKVSSSLLDNHIMTKNINGNNSDINLNLFSPTQANAPSNMTEEPLQFQIVGHKSNVPPVPAGVIATKTQHQRPKTAGAIQTSSHTLLPPSVLISTSTSPTSPSPSPSPSPLHLSYQLHHP